MSRVLELFAGSLLLSPTLPLRVSDSLSSGGTHLTLLRGRRGRCLLGSTTGQQSTCLFELSNFGINRGENVVYSHAKSISNQIQLRPSDGTRQINSELFHLFPFIWRKGRIAQPSAIAV
jgi:hypothetical protein